MSSFDPTTRPGLVYQHAFDWLAVQLAATEKPSAALVTEPFHVAELLRRLPGLTLLDYSVNEREEIAHTLGIYSRKAGVPGNKFAAVAWVEPPKHSFSAKLRDIKKRLTAGAHIYLLVDGPLASMLAERRTKNNPLTGVAGMQVQVGKPIKLLQAVRILINQGFKVLESTGLHGPGAIAWHLAGQAAGQLGRPDLQDCCHFAMRRDFVETGHLHKLSALVCLVAEYAP